jgi:hypothetical protein
MKVQRNEFEIHKRLLQIQKIGFETQKLDLRFKKSHDNG